MIADQAHQQCAMSTERRNVYGNPARCSRRGRIELFDVWVCRQHEPIAYELARRFGNLNGYKERSDGDS